MLSGLFAGASIIYCHVMCKSPTDATFSITVSMYQPSLVQTDDLDVAEKSPIQSFVQAGVFQLHVSTVSRTCIRMQLLGGVLTSAAQPIGAACLLNQVGR